MSLQTVTEVIKWAWCFAPFPWILALLTLASVVWLWLEYQATRLGRKIPGYRRPFPILPEISLGAVRAILFSWLMVRLWALLFVVMLVVGVGMTQKMLPENVSQGVLGLGGYWRSANIWLVKKLPDAIGEHLAPEASCAVSWRDVQSRKSEARTQKLGDLISDPTATPRPTKTPTPTPSSAFQVVILKNANVRAGPGVDEPRIGRAQAGERYLVTGRNSDSTWWRILYKGRTGWVWHELVDSSAAPKDIPAVSP